jgi:uncharacterized protein (DUF2141 family)
MALLVAALGGLAQMADAAAADLVLRVVGLRSDRGAVHYAVYDSPAHFPSYEGRVAKGKADPQGDLAVVRIRGLPPGTYAVAVFHDENGNDSFDQGLFGIPLEDYGFSNDARGFFSAPSFESAAFRVQDPVTEIVIDLRQ